MRQSRKRQSADTSNRHNPERVITRIHDELVGARLQDPKVRIRLVVDDVGLRLEVRHVVGLQRREWRGGGTGGVGGRGSGVGRSGRGGWCGGLLDQNLANHLRVVFAIIVQRLWNRVDLLHSELDETKVQAIVLHARRFCALAVSRIRTRAFDLESEQSSDANDATLRIQKGCPSALILKVYTPIVSTTISGLSRPSIM